MALSHSIQPIARAHTFGLFVRENWIEVSRGLLELFATPDDEPQLAAVLAHEMAHHEKGHCIVDNWLRLFGRVAFVGDGFVRTLVDSFGHEIEADRVALGDFHADADELVRCLWRIHHVSAAYAETAMVAATGLEMLPRSFSMYAQALVDGPQVLSHRKRWYLSFACFVNYYTGGDRTAYWHPCLDERRRHLLESASDNT